MAQAGWYEDAESPGAQRYWDGQQWTPQGQRKSQSRPSKRVFVLAGLALLTVIAALVAGRVELGNFLPGILLVTVIAILAVTLAVRSGQSSKRKAIFVTTVVLIVALAIPASLKVVYPLYDHFLPNGSLHAGTASSASYDANTGDYRASVDGQAIDFAATCKTSGCHPPLGVSCGSPEQTSEGDNEFTITVGTGNGVGGELAQASIVAVNPVRMAGIFIDGSKADAPKYWVGQNTGEMSVTANGKTYTMTGNVRPVDHPAEPGPGNDRSTPIGPSVPFEFTATCP